MQRLRGAIEQARKLLDADAVEALVEKVGAARRIGVLPTGLAQAAAYNLVNLLEQGGFLVAVSQNTVTDLARAVSTATDEDLLIGVDVAGETPYIARALAEARALGIPTAAIAGAASLEVANAADIVVAAQSQPQVGLGIVVMDAVVYTLAEALRWRYPERFKGSEKALEAMFDRIQVGDK
jgi:DNA-binding MurR/RpiR family transcriptional regulator